MFRYVIILVLLVLTVAECWAVQPYEPVQPDPFLEPWRWQFFDELNGQGLQCLAEDSSGNMWFGIDEGVVRYDGINWTTYRPEDGLHGAPVITLRAGRDGDVFAGTAQGISRFKDGAWQRIFPPEGEMAWEVNGLTQTSDGSLWAATQLGPLQLKGGIFTLYHREKTQAALADSAAYLRFVTIPETALPSEGDFPAFDVFEGRDGMMWFSCEGRAAGMGRRGDEILRCDLQKVLANDPEAWRLYTEADGLDSGRRARIIQTRDGVIWSASDQGRAGVNRFDGKAWSHIRLSDLGGSNYNPSILETRDGTVWVSGAFSTFVHIFRDGRWHIRTFAALANTPSFQSHSLPGHRPRLLEASDGALWMAGLGQGAVRVDLNASRWQSYEGLRYQGETSDSARWFQSRDSGVVRSNGKVWMRYGVEDGLMDTPGSLMITRNNEVWAAGSHENIAATARFDGSRWQLKQHPRVAGRLNPGGIYEASDGSLWFSTVPGRVRREQQLGGLLKFDGQTWTHYVPPEAPVVAYGIAQTPDERLWFTGPRFSSFDGQTWTPVTEPQELALPFSQRAYVTREGDLWVGHRTYGIFRYNGQTWTRYDMQDGLAHGRVYAISQTADGSLWAGTEQGTSRFDGQTWTHMPHFGVLGSLHQSRDGAMWMNLRRRVDDTREGSRPLVIRYQPNTVAPETEITLFADEVSQPGNTTLAWTGADPWRLTSNARLQYAYRLDGGEWSAFSQEKNRIFQALDSGRHTFEVKARDLDFNEDPTPASVTFIVVPPVWQQPWFLGLMAILLGGIGFQTTRVVRRDRRLQESNTALSSANKELFGLNEDLQHKTDDLDQSNQALQQKTDDLDQSNQELIVEAALERVRAKALEMQKSEELSGVSETLFAEFERLGFELCYSSIVIVDEDRDIMEWWLGRKDYPGPKVLRSVFSEMMRKYLNSPIGEAVEAFIEARSEGKPNYVIELQGEALIGHWQVEKEEFSEYGGWYSKLMSTLPPRQTFQFVFFTKGHLYLVSKDALTATDLAIAKRFADVFDFAYARFLELQEKEVQARDAELRAAVDRVRAETAEMRESQDITNLLAVLWEAVVGAGMQVDGVTLNVEDPTEDVVHIYGVGPHGWGEDLPADKILRTDKTRGVFLNKTEVPLASARAWGWALKEDEPNFWEAPADFGEQLKTAWGMEFPEDLLNQAIGMNVPFDYGGIFVGRFTGVPAFTEADLQTLCQFADAVSMGFTRFFDFQQLETQNRAMSDANKELFQANQALQRDSAVERIRGEVQAMEQASDFERVLSLLSEDLKTVGLAFDTCGIEVLDEPVDDPTMAYFEGHGYRYTAYTIDPDGTVASNSYHIPAPFRPMDLEILERFIAGKPWQGRSEQTAILEVPASNYGRLRITSSERQDFTEEDIASLQDFASAIALGYARYLDIREIQEQTEKKSAFLASMPHDLRTPMNAIKGFTNLVLGRRSENLTERQRGNLEKVTQASDQLLAMINDLLDLSKIEAGQMDVNVSTFDVGQLVDYCVSTVSPLVQEGVTLSAEVDEGVGEAHTDEVRLRRMLINLASNAIKFTDSGRVTVKAGQADGHLNLSVSDTGKGIPEDELATIFDEYRQVEGSDREHKGTGLGLSITKQFAELLGGSISVQSEVGKGSTFTVRVPVVYKEM